MASIQIEESTRERLKSIGSKTDTYDSIINRLLTNTTSEPSLTVAVHLKDYDEVIDALRTGGDAAARLEAIDKWLTDTKHPDADKIRSIANNALEHSGAEKKED